MNVQGSGGFTARRMRWSDIPQILCIARQSMPSPWIEQDFLDKFRASESIGWVVIDDRQVVGFAHCTVFWKSEKPRGSVLQRFCDCLRWLVDARSGQPWRLDVFALAVAPACPRTEITAALLTGLDRELRCDGDCLRVTVPETDLPAQQFLRAAGYRAFGVRTGHDGRQDSYLMERCADIRPMGPSDESRLEGESFVVGHAVSGRS